MTRPNNEEHVYVAVAYELVEMRVDEGEARTGAPMAQKTGLDVVKSEVVLEEDIVVQEYHGCAQELEEQGIEREGGPAAM